MKLSTFQALTNKGFYNIYSVTGDEISKIKPIYQMQLNFGKDELQSFLNLTDIRKVAISGARQTGKTFLLDSVVKHMLSINSRARIIYACPDAQSVKHHANSIMKQLESFVRVERYTDNIVTFFGGARIHFAPHDSRYYVGFAGFDCLLIDDACHLSKDTFLSMFLSLQKRHRIVMVHNRSYEMQDIINSFGFQEVIINGYSTRQFRQHSGTSSSAYHDRGVEGFRDLCFSHVRN